MFKNELKQFDPKALNGYIKNIETTIIFVEMWDYKAKKPISADDFIKNKFRSPLMLMVYHWTEQGKQLLDNDYTVIIRKPSGDLVLIGVVINHRTEYES